MTTPELWARSRFNSGLLAGRPASRHPEDLAGVVAPEGGTMTQHADQLLAFPLNTRWNAAHWIVSGERHPQEHWVISERLTKWRQQAAGCRGELQAAAQSILAEFERERAAAARQSREWIMPAPAPTATVINMTVPATALRQDGGEAGSPLPWEAPALSRTKMAVCEECGTPFPRQRSTARFCSQACQKRARRAA